MFRLFEQVYTNQKVKLLKTLLQSIEMSQWKEQIGLGQSKLKLKP